MLILNAAPDQDLCEEKKFRLIQHLSKGLVSVTHLVKVEASVGTVARGTRQLQVVRSNLQYTCSATCCGFSAAKAVYHVPAFQRTSNIVSDRKRQDNRDRAQRWGASPAVPNVRGMDLGLFVRGNSLVSLLWVCVLVPVVNFTYSGQLTPCTFDNVRVTTIHVAVMN